MDPIWRGYPSQMRILLEAYSCRVGAGSEPGQGWGWALALARHGHDVTVLTRPKNRAANQAWAANNPMPGLTFEYIASHWSGVIERRVGKQADYMAWTRRATSRALLLHRREPFDVAHHVTFGTILLGSAMPQIGVPFVYGPLGGGQSTPAAARPWFEASWRKERARNAVVWATPLNPLARSAVRGAVVLATNDQTAQLALRMGAREVLPMADTGIDESLIRAPRSRPGGRRLIWVGSARPRKGLNLAIQSLLSSNSETTLSVYGPSDDTVGRLARKYGLQDRVHPAGWVPWAEVQQAYGDHDAMLFTSLRDSLGGQLVEAAAAGLPIIGLNLHGLASVLPPTVAEKVPLSARAHHDLAAAVETALSPVRYGAMSAAAVAFASEQTWSRRAAAVSQIFRRLTTASAA